MTGGDRPGPHPGVLRSAVQGASACRPGTVERGGGRSTQPDRSVSHHGRYLVSGRF